MGTKWNIFVARNCLLFLCLLFVMTADTAKDKQLVSAYRNGNRVRSIRCTGNPQHRKLIRATTLSKGDLCNEDSSDCQSQEQDSNLIANIRKGRSRRFERPNFLRRQLTPIFIVQRRPGFQYSYTPPVKTFRALDAIDIMEHLLVRGMEEYGGWKNPAEKKKKLTLGKGNRPMAWNESEDDDFDDSENDSDPYPFSLYKPTGNIYHAGNKYYSGSHDHINLLKKYGVTKYKHAEYHLKPLVSHESEEDFDDLWDREYDRSDLYRHNIPTHPLPNTWPDY